MGRRHRAGHQPEPDLSRGLRLGLNSECSDLATRHWSERVACSYLTSLGWQLLANNYRLRGAELDLVMQDGATVVVVEVKQRKSADFGHPAEAIDIRKLSRLRAAAQHFVSYQLHAPYTGLRIDAVLLLGTERSYQLEHLENVA